ncbi:biotin transporter BioY [Yoonia sp. F2084L]|uniref:biotin transporter BioY n=1 Tax=Yoonia sp. F2084L TaxID=2926419 RepID=UPI001FF3F35F|nr:biotin transporter BioY [Yoonia sp. F2084L]MCK0094184.1 biotin transporter BioY [Yoonia sp. F2084L]
MALALNDKVLAEAFGPSEGTALRVKQVAMVVLGIVALAILAKVKVPMWPVPITMGTFAVLTIGATYGPRLGLATILGYMIVGALGFDVFAGSTAENYGLAYMMGGTGGYLLGYVLATLALGFAARAGWDRSVLMMAVALLIANALIYLPGVAWLTVLYEGKTLAWAVEVGLTPFLIGDALKLGLAALLVPGLWKLIGNART